MRGKLQDKLDNEYRNLHEEIARRTQAAVFAIARKTLTDLAGAEPGSTHGRGVRPPPARTWRQRAQQIGGYRGHRASSPCAAHSSCRSRSEATIEESIKTTLGTGDPVRFEIVPGLIGGIELILQGQKVAWSISDHLASLEKELAALLKAQRHEG